MRPTLHLTFLSLLTTFLLIASACEQEDTCPDQAATDQTIEILPLGDSRVEGARPAFESYRYELWKRLINNNQDVDFIGSRIDDASYPTVMGRCFDNEHEGTGGAKTEDILATLNQLQLTSPPEIVLLGIGGNNLLDEPDQPLSEIIDDIDQIIRQLRQRNPQVAVILEQIAPATSELMTPAFTERLTAFNNRIPELAASLTTPESRVIVVNMREGFTDDLLADAVHYNEAGAAFVAERYFRAISEL